MNVAMCFALVCLSCMQAFAQRWIPNTDVGIVDPIESVIWDWSNGVTLIETSRYGGTTRFWFGSIGCGTFRPSSFGKNWVHGRSSDPIASLQGQVWIATKKKAFVTSDHHQRDSTVIAANNRRIRRMGATSIGENALLLTVNNYIGKRIDPNGCSLTESIHDEHGEAYFIQGRDIERIATWPTDQSPISNAIPAADSLWCVAMRVDSTQEDVLAYFDKHGVQRTIPSPTPISGVLLPSSATRTSDGIIYVLYDGVPVNGEFADMMFRYDEVQGAGAWHLLPKSIFYSKSIPLAPSKIAVCTSDGILIVDGTTTRYRPLMHPNTGEQLRPVSLAVSGTDTLVVACRNGFWITGMDEL